MRGVRVLVGTRKGAFVLTADELRRDWKVQGPHFAGWEIYHVKGSPVDPNRLYASQTSGWFGQQIQRSNDGVAGNHSFVSMGAAGFAWSTISPTTVVAAFSTVAGGVASDLEDHAAQGQLEVARLLMEQLETMAQELMLAVGGLSLETLRQLTVFGDDPN